MTDPCTYGSHDRVNDGVTDDGQQLWHCSRCDFGVRAPVPRVEFRPRLDWAWFRPFFWTLVTIVCATLLLLVTCERSKAAEFPAEQTPALPAGWWVTAEATAYCPCARCTDGDRITANGTRTNRVPYAIAADRSLPMGSQVFIPAGMGYLDRLRPADRVFTVDDRGGALDTEALRSGVFRIDLRYRDHADAQRFGRRLLAVYVFAPRPPPPN